MYLQLVTAKYILSIQHSTAAQSEPMEQGKLKMAAWLYYIGIALVSKHQVHHSSQKRGAIEILELHNLHYTPFLQKRNPRAPKGSHFYIVCPVHIQEQWPGVKAQLKYRQCYVKTFGFAPVQET